MSETYELNSLNIIKSAKVGNGLFVLEVADKDLKRIIKGVTMAPGKSGSLNINIRVTSDKKNSGFLTFVTDVKNVKVPTVEPISQIAFAYGDGEATIHNQNQLEMFGSTTEIDEDTGEVTVIDDEDSNITPIGEAK